MKNAAVAVRLRFSSGTPATAGCLRPLRQLSTKVEVPSSAASSTPAQLGGTLDRAVTQPVRGPVSGSQGRSSERLARALPSTRRRARPASRAERLRRQRAPSTATPRMSLPFCSRLYKGSTASAPLTARSAGGAGADTAAAACCTASQRPRPATRQRASGPKRHKPTGTVLPVIEQKRRRLGTASMQHVRTQHRAIPWRVHAPARERHCLSDALCLPGPLALPGCLCKRCAGHRAAWCIR